MNDFFFNFFLCFSILQQNRYKILCANAIKDGMDPKIATELILDAIALEQDQFRLGATKVQSHPNLNIKT